MHLRRSSVLVLALLPLTFAAACAHGGHADLSPLESAADGAQDGGGSPRNLALAGFHAYLVKGNARALDDLSRRALAADPGEPWALQARAELARRDLRAVDEARALLSLLEKAPDHPLAVIAAGRLGRLARTSLTVDDEILRRGEPLLDRPLPGETRTRLRGVVRGIHLARGDDASALVRDGGLLTEAAVVGPFSPWHSLDAKALFAPEREAAVSASNLGASGETLGLRTLRFPAGALSLAPEPRIGDVFYALAVADVPTSGKHVVRLAGEAGGSVAVLVDGVRVVSRSALGRAEPTAIAAAVDLDAGSHLVVVRIDRGSARGDVMLSIAPEDGSPSGVRFRAARPGDAGGAPPALVDGSSATPAAAELAAQLDDVGALGAYLAAADAKERDPAGARTLLDEALAAMPRSPALLTLRAEMAVDDPFISDAIGSARAASDLEQALAVDPGSANALVATARLLAASGRPDDALKKLDAAEPASPASAAIPLARARVQLARNLDAEARDLARAALQRDPGSCEAGQLAIDLAERVDAVAESDAAVRRFAACSGGRSRLASILEKRGDLEGALGLVRAMHAVTPFDPDDAERIADLLLAQDKPGAAAAELEKVEALWPRMPHLLRRRAELLDRAGEHDVARSVRERALGIDGGDLGLHRSMAYAQGTDVLGDLHRDAFQMIGEFEARGRSYDTPAVVLLDFAAVQAFPDGSTIERTQTIAQVLDKSGIDDLGEFTTPAGAQILTLRTIKKDGRVLEPESIAGKDTVSMPGLEVGDYVEREYLVAHSGRGPAIPGWSSAPFFFREPGVPLLESVYVIRARKDAGLEMDAHNGMEPAAIVEKDGWLSVTFRRTDNDAVIPEPSEPSRFETLPWVQVGAGAGDDRMALVIADGLADETLRSPEVVQWAHAVAATAGDDPLAIVQALYADLMQRIPGSDSVFGSRATQVFASGRGSRAVLLKAALDELGIDSHFASVRTFDEDPASYRFPRDSRWSYLLLAVRLHAGDPVIWLDPSVRWAPFGEIAESAQGVPATLLPAPGEKPVELRTPVQEPRGRLDVVEARLSASGDLEGSGSERYDGYDAALVRQALEKMDDDRRRQALESGLARAFPGASVEGVTVEMDAGVGKPVVIRYRFRAPGFARLEGGRLALPLDFFASRLGRRYLARGTRAVPLLLRDPDGSRTRLSIELPPGSEIVQAPSAASAKGPFGSYVREVQVSAGKLLVQDSVRIERGRIEPAAYADFARFVQAIDRYQDDALVVKAEATSAQR